MKKVHNVVLNSQRFSVHFNWKFALLVAACLPVFIKAGLWQLDRLADKQDLQQRYQQAQNRVAVPMVSTPSSPYQKIWVTGKIRNQYWLADNQMRQGKVGYEVIQVLDVKQLGPVFVALGWIKGDFDKSKLPQVTPLNGDITLEGSLHLIPENRLIRASLVQADDKVLPAIDRAVFTNITSQDFHPFFIRADNALLEQVTPQRKVPDFTPEKHRAYALQWFSFAIIALGMFVWQSLTREEENAS